MMASHSSSVNYIHVCVCIKLVSGDTEEDHILISTMINDYEVSKRFMKYHISEGCDRLVYYQKFQDVMKDHVIFFLYQHPGKILPQL